MKTPLLLLTLLALALSGCATTKKCAPSDSKCVAPEKKCCAKKEMAH